jgi:phosphoribosylglycinamide formyltransferase-1
VSARIVVLASGHGTNLQAIIDACAAGEIDGSVAAVIADRPEAYALERAAAAGIARVALTRLPAEERTDYDARLAAVVAGYAPDWVVLAGWMRILTSTFLGLFPNRVVNLHPALPGAFPGTKAIERAFAAHEQDGLDTTGVMVHLVPDEGVDNGPVLASAVVPIEPDDTIDSLSARVHLTEHRLLVETLARLCAQEVSA